jgi:threonine/homoserine/homoserine lactone efflux protein
MIPVNELLIFALAALGLVLTPGPNMIYLISRSITQGHRAGLISLLGIVVGFICHILAATLGLTAIFIAIPAAYTAVKLLGAIYLLWIAWQTIRPGAEFVFSPKKLSQDSSRTLFQMGMFTSLLNPKIAVFYMALFPQFIKPENGSVIWQSLELGLMQITVSSSVNTIIIFTAGTIATWFATKPTWVKIQKWVMAVVLGGLAVRLALDEAKP